MRALGPVIRVEQQTQPWHSRQQPVDGVGMIGRPPVIFNDNLDAQRLRPANDLFVSCHNYVEDVIERLLATAGVDAQLFSAEFVRNLQPAIAPRLIRGAPFGGRLEDMRAIDGDTTHR